MASAKYQGQVPVLRKQLLFSKIDGTLASSFGIISHFIRFCQAKNATQCGSSRRQGKFPDCLAKRQVAPGKWQHLRIEFEYESRNFKLHGHDPKGCDMIVCWRHNWKDCPAEIEVVELCRLIG